MTPDSPEARQLVLDLRPTPSFAREDFLVSSSNRAAWSLIESWPNWPDCALLLVGPPGAGKSHLAAIWAERAGAEVLPAGRLCEQGGTFDSSRPLAIEDPDRVEPLDERAFFHLLNRARAEGRFLLITARRPVDAWRLRVPDLASRLRQAPAARLEEPSEDLMRALLMKLFVDRQLVVEPPVLDYLALRLPRAFAAARAMIEALDAEALSRGRRISRALAADVFAACAARQDWNEGSLSW
jgi:chromosomal replication initiation ATPase DnaA